jgi:UDP-N-acetylglucosamine 2-epimerase (non-hydrolysing)
MKKKKICLVLGTRPEAIKMAPLILTLKNDDLFNVFVLATGQHTDMLLSPLEFFGIIPDFNLEIMREKQSLDYVTSAVLTGVGAILDKILPDIVLVHGDTTTTFSSTLAAFYRKIPVGHVEAGLRSNNIFQPFPEEMNRIMTDKISTFLFAPTSGALKNLYDEGFPQEKVWLTGNTIVDALKLASIKTIIPKNQNLQNIPPDVPMVLVTAHRRESWGDGLYRICSAILEIYKQKNEAWFLIPMHKNPVVRKVFREKLSSRKRIVLCEPLNYPDFIWAMKRSSFIISDSGGIQEEATVLQKNVLVLREETERPEAIQAGTAILVGTDTNAIVSESLNLFSVINKNQQQMQRRENPFGDGNASERIKEVLYSF